MGAPPDRPAATAAPSGEPDEPSIRGCDLELPIAFAEPGGRVVINYGILTGREATQAEIDRLAQSLYSEAGAGPDLTITAVRRQDYGRHIETVSHQVIVDTTGGLASDVKAICRVWALGCADDRRVEPIEL